MRSVVQWVLEFFRADESKCFLRSFKARLRGLPRKELRTMPINFHIGNTKAFKMTQWNSHLGNMFTKHIKINPALCARLFVLEINSWISFITISLHETFINISRKDGTAPKRGFSIVQAILIDVWFTRKIQSALIRMTKLSRPRPLSQRNKSENRSIELLWKVIRHLRDFEIHKRNNVVFGFQLHMIVKRPRAITLSTCEKATCMTEWPRKRLKLCPRN